MGCDDVRNIHLFCRMNNIAWSTMVLLKGKLTLARAWASSRAFWAAARSLATSSSAADMRSADAAALFFMMLMEAPSFVLETTGENASDVPDMAAVAAMAAAVNLLRRFVEGIIVYTYVLGLLCGVSDASIMMASRARPRQHLGATSSCPLTTHI